jgi:hypothetical protein
MGLTRRWATRSYHYMWMNELVCRKYFSDLGELVRWIPVCLQKANLAVIFTRLSLSSTSWTIRNNWRFCHKNWITFVYVSQIIVAPAPRHSLRDDIQTFNEIKHFSITGKHNADTPTSTQSKCMKSYWLVKAKTLDL